MPTSIKEIQSFLGFANYYRKFIKDYGKTVVTLTNLTKKDVPFEWSKDAQQEFETLKRRFTEEPILAHYDPNEKAILEMDASDYAIGACMSQKGSDNKLRPIA